MFDGNRDLLVLDSTLSPDEFVKQVELLNAVLFHVENWEAFSTANEIIDLNRRKIFYSLLQIRKALTMRKNKPFVFVCNKN